MKLTPAESIVIRNRDFKERDRLVTFLTREFGKLTGIAKGVKKITSRGIGAHEPLTHCVLHFADKPGGDLVHIRKTDLLPPHLYLHQNLDSYLYLTYFAELADLGCVPRQPVPEVFDLLEGALGTAAGGDKADWPVLRLAFEMDWLRAIGLAPEWRRCVGCGAPIYVRGKGGLLLRREAPHQFDVSGGGVRCPDCMAAGPGRHPLHPETLAQLAPWRTARDGPAPPPHAAAQAELTACVHGHLRYHLERHPRSLDLLPLSHRPAPRGAQRFSG